MIANLGLQVVVPRQMLRLDSTDRHGIHKCALTRRPSKQPFQHRLHDNGHGVSVDRLISTKHRGEIRPHVVFGHSVQDRSRFEGPYLSWKRCQKHQETDSKILRVKFPNRTAREPVCIEKITGCAALYQRLYLAAHKLLWADTHQGN